MTGLRNSSPLSHARKPNLGGPMPLQHRADFTVPVLLLALLIVSTALVRAAVGTTAQVSVSSTGQGGNELSRDATISADGRFVVLAADGHLWPYPRWRRGGDGGSGGGWGGEAGVSAWKG